MRLVAWLATVTVLAIPAGAASSTTGFRGTVSVIDASMRARMTGRSWHPGCPVSIGQLRLLTLAYRSFDNRSHTGRLVVNADVAGAVVSVFHRLYDARFPIRRMQPVDDYGGSDFRSIEADNTSSFNCRAATGSTHWSEHAYGHAIDVDPIENPYVDGGRTSHAASLSYLDRSKLHRGMVTPAVVQAFRSISWGWGGAWTGSTRDYMHFSATGH